MIGRCLITIALSAPFLCAGAPVAWAELPTTPKNAVRSLNHIQDAIARGDPAAFRLQAQMLKVIDELLVGAQTQDPESAEYRDAVLAYAVSGGNPATFGALYGEVTRQADEDQLEVARAVAALLRRRPLAEDEAPDPYAIGGMLGGGLALLYGLNASETDAQLDQFRAAALIAPGTLIEESALRRLMPILVEAEDFDEFLAVSSRYARAFVNSPYAADFALSLVEGGTELTRSAQFGLLADIFNFMPSAHRRSIVSRQMRAATIGGNFELVRFLEDRFAGDIEAAAAPQAAEAAPVDNDNDDAVRQRLYALMASITSSNHAEVAAELDAIDAGALPQADRRLLAAARAVVADIIRPAADPVSKVDDRAPPPATDAAVQAPADDGSLMSDLPQQPSENSVRTILPNPGGAAAPMERADTGMMMSDMPDAKMPMSADDAEDGAHADFVSNARDALDRMDATLQETAQ